MFSKSCYTYQTIDINGFRGFYIENNFSENHVFIDCLELNIPFFKQVCKTTFFEKCDLQEVKCYEIRLLNIQSILLII